MTPYITRNIARWFICPPGAAEHVLEVLFPTMGSTTAPITEVLHPDNVHVGKYNPEVFFTWNITQRSSCGDDVGWCEVKAGFDKQYGRCARC